jgi:hypothetical protein
MAEKVVIMNKNRFCINFAGYGPVPIETRTDHAPLFVSDPPRKIGDEAIVLVKGHKRRVMLLRSKGHMRNSLWLVDMGTP